MELLFPYEQVRPVQADLMKDIQRAFSEQKNILAHAPTGLGKTAAALSVAVPFAIAHKLTVFFLTHRHTQHAIALETLAAMKKKHQVDFDVVDLIGKMHMCLQPDVERLHHSEFMDYCSAVRENDTCSFYTKLYGKNSRELGVNAHRAEAALKNNHITGVHEVKTVCGQHGICPYYFSVERAKKARVIVADYFNVFHPVVRDAFFSRIGVELEKSLLIVDEAHNLADRIRAVMSSRLSSLVIRNSVIEAKKFGYSPLIPHLQELQRVLTGLSLGVDERLVSRDDFVASVRTFCDYDSFVDSLESAGDAVRERVQRSSLAHIAEFLDAWTSGEQGFVRFIEQKEFSSGPALVLHHSCLDPALVSAPAFERAYASVLMSGTLMPPTLFRDILGVPRSELRVYGSPFPAENRLALILPHATTQFTQRSEMMYARIASVCCDIIDAVPGNCAFYFPSYSLRDAVVKQVEGRCSKQLFLEDAHFTSQQKSRVLEEFKACKDKGAALFAVISAHFSEGIDLPGDYLKAVVVVGLPFARPTIQSRALVDYYGKRFGRGMEYGYIYPALIKCLQAAGRCIRTENDKGAVVFLDHRYLQLRYSACIPPEWKARACEDYKEEIKAFFSNFP